MGGKQMGRIVAGLWQKTVSWLSVLSSAHVVDDGSDEKRDQPKKNQTLKLKLVSGRG